MSALPETTTLKSDAPSTKPHVMRRALAAAYVGVVRPTVAFWASHWWLLALMVPALIALKVFLIMAGVPWWLIAVMAAGLIAVKVFLISWHARRSAPQGRRTDT